MKVNSTSASSGEGQFDSGQVDFGQLDFGQSRFRPKRLRPLAEVELAEVELAEVECPRTPHGCSKHPDNERFHFIHRTCHLFPKKFGNRMQGTDVPRSAALSAVASEVHTALGTVSFAIVSEVHPVCV